jgi:hypothetical protein
MNCTTTHGSTNIKFMSNISELKILELRSCVLPDSPEPAPSNTLLFRHFIMLNERRACTVLDRLRTSTSRDWRPEVTASKQHPLLCDYSGKITSSTHKSASRRVTH